LGKPAVPPRAVKDGENREVQQERDNFKTVPEREEKIGEK